jgi:hypothetical protein
MRGDARTNSLTRINGGLRQSISLKKRKHNVALSERPNALARVAVRQQRTPVPGLARVLIAISDRPNARRSRKLSQSKHADI